MKETLKILIENLVEEPNEVTITETNKNNTVIYEVRVADKDMGKVIGREGKVAKSIRTIMKSIATRNHIKVTVEFVEK